MNKILLLLLILICSCQKTQKNNSVKQPSANSLNRQMVRAHMYCFQEENEKKCAESREKLSGNPMIAKVAENFKSTCGLRGTSNCAIAGFLEEIRGNTKVAVEYLEKGCGFADKMSCHNLGVLFNSNQNPELAADAFERACLFGQMRSCDNAGVIYLKLEKYDLAVENLTKGCANKDANACYNLACAHSLKKEKNSSLRALRLSVDLGFDKAEHLDKDTDLDFIRKDKAFKQIRSNLLKKSKMKKI